MHNCMTCSGDTHLDNSLTGLQLLRFTVFMQPGNPSQFQQRPAIAPHSQALERSLHFHS